MGINDNSFSIVNPAQDEAPDGIPKYNDAKYPIGLELLTAHTGCTEQNSTNFEITYLMVHTNVQLYKP